MKIGLDLKPFYTGSKYRGIGTYSRELIKELIQCDENIEYHMLNLYAEYDNDPNMNGHCILHNYYNGPQIVDVGEKQLFRNKRLDCYREAQIRHFLQQSNIDIMFFTSPNEYGSMYKKEWFSDVFTVGILYDLIPMLFPEQCLFNKQYADDYMESLDFLKSLDLLLAISESAKDDAVKLLGIPEEKIKVIYAGIDQDFKKLSQVNIPKLKIKYNIIDSFIMFAGGIDFKKNLEGLIRAYARLGKNITNRYQLLIVGKLSLDLSDKLLEIARQEGIENRVLCIGFIPKEDLIELYNIAEMFVFPSLYEGFGLPVIEAMACGTRVVTSDSSSLKEIAEGHAVLVNPKSVKSISKGMMEIINHPIESLKIAERSIEYALGYTWEKVACLTIKYLQDVFMITKKEKRDYNFKIEDTLLKDISYLYAGHGEIFSNEMMETVTYQMLCIRNKMELPVVKGNTRILYDVSVVIEWLRGKYSTGIGRVCIELYKELSKIVNVIPISLTRLKGNVIVHRVSLKNLEILDEVIDILKEDIYFMPELHLRGIQVPENYPGSEYFKEKGIKCYAILYDLLPLQFPQYFENKTANRFHSYIVELLESYDGILTDSKAVSDDLIKYYKENIKKDLRNPVAVGYFHLGQNFSKKTERFKGNSMLQSFFNVESPVFYMLGTIEPRKGHEIVLRVFEHMWKRGKECKLCIMGHMGWNMGDFIQKLKHHPETGKRLLFMEAATDDEVIFAYQNSSALIQASAGEGFGLPLIEAGQYDLPIICSDIPVFHEVTEEHALFFDRSDENNLIDVINEFIEMSANRTVPSSKEIKGKKWRDTANKVYNMVVNEADWYQQIK